MRTSPALTLTLGLLLLFAACGEEPAGPVTDSGADQRLALVTGAPVEVSCGQVVTESIALANDLVDCPGDGLVVGADHIVIDGRGHTIDGQGIGSGVRIEGRSGVTVRNLRITEFLRGVWLTGGASANRVVRNEISAGFGVHLSAAEGNEVARNWFTQNRIAVILRGRSTGNRISNNRIDSPISMGIDLERASGNRLEHNQIANPGAAGIGLNQASGNHLAHNRISGSGDTGIDLFIASQNRLEHNRVSGSRLDGFYLLPDLDPSTDTRDNELVGNVSEENGGFGFSDRDSGGSGTAGTANFYDGNRCRGNEEGPSSPEGLCRSLTATAGGSRARR